jgi:hypothetical protein
MLKQPEEPKEPKKRPGVGCLMIWVVVTLIAVALVWAFTAR